ncbi:nuclear transport factor 2 family protein [Qipengyuania vesicularis]|uniref:nuclear transport factor 2 family protein n=1 Tax=Qipengyuania vesicularis TaxID=2867232 RepID=UPI001C88746F|nr:nuclear transport factor 2 family protein [Qipengyuania vesicularis]MBX7528553.1 nuclear transport factor 2 family protein [Qipengyuania vesicularis]
MIAIASKYPALAAAVLALAAPAAAQDAPQRRYAEASAQTATVADAYFAAYIANDWDALEPLLAEDASFHDPTSERIFGGAPVEGKEALMAFFRSAYASIVEAEFTTERSLHAGDVAVYEGTLSWTAVIGGELTVSSTMPVVTILEQEGGKIVSHRDYADYAPFLAALAEARSARAMDHADHAAHSAEETK